MLELKNISTGYGKQSILEGVTTTFEKGKLTSVIGINGCGKSTMLKTIIGILPVSEGEITIDGEKLLDMSRNEIAKKVSYLAQGKSTPDMTVFQMVLHGRFPYLAYPRRYTKDDREIAYEAMKTMGIEELAEKPLYTLSGGMRQSAYIAMALAQDTDYILLDEPTTYLDIAHQLELMRIMRRLADSGKGIVTVMHGLPMSFDYSDKIVVISNKKVLHEASPHEMIHSTVIKDVFGVEINLTPKGKYFYMHS